MIQGSLKGRGLADNVIFDVGSPANRDNCFAPYAALRQRFLAAGVRLDTSDSLAAQPAFELHQDVQPFSPDGVTAYLLMFETPLIKPENDDRQRLAAYRRVFTWRDDLVDGERFVKINFPNPLVVPEVDGWAGRDIFCSLIAANKTLVRPDPRDLYVERVRTIRWFEQHAPDSLHLYGVDWDMPVMPAGLVGKVARRIFRYLPGALRGKPFPSYRGRVANKRDVLRRSRFAICYENVRGYDGYITEKIFDCFFSGCVPVYWGPDNITDYIPADCFVDRRAFPDTAALHRHLCSLDEARYRVFQQNIRDFLSSDAARAFGSAFFAETVADTIVNDLGGQG